MHAADDADIVDRFGGLGEELADFDSALAILLEFEGRRQRGPRFAFGGQVGNRQFFAGKLGQAWFGVKRIEMGRAAVHKQVNDAFGLRGKLRRAGRQGMDRIDERGGGIGLVQQLAQG